MSSSEVNTLGSHGNYGVESGGDIYLTCGSDVNSWPATAVNGTGYELTKECVGENSGPFQVNGSLPSYRSISTASMHRTGNFNVFAANRIALEAAAGGIELVSTGNISINPMGGLLNVNAPAAAELVAGTLHMAGADGMVIDGGACQNNCESNNFKGNVEFGTNLTLSGGLSVGGEAYIPHMTSQKQKMTTDPAGQTSGSLNPCQSYAVASGSSKLAKTIPSIPCDVKSAPTDVGWIPTNIKVGIKGIPGLPEPLQVETMCYIQFPRGIRLFSDGVYKNNPSTLAMWGMATPDLEIDSGDESDFSGPGHVHDYYIPACDLLDSTSDVFAAAKGCESKDPKTINEMKIGGVPQGDFKNAMTNTLKEQAKQQFIDPPKRWAETFAKAKAGRVAAALK